MESLYFALGILNNLYLIFIFIARKMKGIAFVRRIGKYYFLLAVPAIALLVLAIVQGRQIEYVIFLSIFLFYLLLEYLFDFVLKTDFRRDWKMLVPYLVFYYAMNYGFFAMCWKYSVVFGAVMLGLAVVQIAVNIWSHGRRKNSP